MKTFTKWIVSRSIKKHHSITNLKVRAKYGQLEGWSSIIVNTVLFFIKISLGLSLKSISLIADAIHTLSDSVTSAVIILGFNIAKKPSDREHPFGHGRMESIATLVVSILLFVAGFELLQGSIRNIMTPKVSTASNTAIFIIVATIIIKEIMARFSFELGEIIDSKALRADALHHRSDVLATSLVVIALITARYGHPTIDGVMGIVVSLIIFYSAYAISKEAISPLLGEAPSKELLKEIEQIAKDHNDVLGVHDIIYHKYGQMCILSLHIEVSSSGDIMHLHSLAEQIEDKIGKKVCGDAVVHIDPVNNGHPKYNTISETLTEIISQEKRVHSFHDLRIVGNNPERCEAVFDIALEEGTDDQDIYNIIQYIQKRFKERFPGMKAIIKAEPQYIYNP